MRHPAGIDGGEAKMRKKFRLFIPALVLAGFLFLSGAGGDVTVYITNSGTRYHLEGCSSLRRSRIALSLNDAVNRGYTPCGICRPPVPDGAAGRTAGENPGDESSRDSLYRVNGLDLSSQADLGRMVRAEVTGHVDGDTVKVHIADPPEGLSADETIRMLGVDTPETVHPSRPVEHFGREASDYTKASLLGKTVYLAFDWDIRDRYGRLLAYIYLAGDSPRCFNAVLIRQGYAHAYTRFVFRFMEEFRSLEREAREEGRGLWGE
jgi:micrococcal nuclease